MTHRGDGITLKGRELAVIAFPEGHATLLETAPGIAVADVLVATNAELRVSADVRPMPLGTRVELCSAP